MKNFLIVLLMAAVAGGGYWALKKYRPNNQAEPSAKYYSQDGIAFSYPTDYHSQPVESAKPGEARTLATISAETPTRLIQLSRELAGLKGARAAKIEPLDFLESSATKTFPDRYPDFTLEQKSRREVADHSVSQLDFNYAGANQTKVYVRYLLMPIENDVLHLVFQSTNPERLDEDAAAVLDSFTF